MPSFIVHDLNDHLTVLSGEESRHCMKVLRKKPGDFVELTDGNGMRARARIVRTERHHCELEIMEKERIEPDPFHIHIVLAPVKNQERIEWFVEKATEIGVHEISFILTEHAERKVVNTDRMVRKAASAIKQSGRYYLPLIHEAQPFTNWIESHSADELFIAATNDPGAGLLSRSATAGTGYILLIGPEGGFSEDEMEKATRSGYKKVSLGKHILRAETAGVAGCLMLCEVNF